MPTTITGSPILESQRSGNMPTLTHDQTIHLDIAGLVFKVVGATGPSIAWLKERYQPFLSSKPAVFTLMVKPLERRPRGRPSRPSVGWRNGNFQIKMATCHAESNLSARRVRLSVPPVAAALSPSLFRFLCSLLLLKKGSFLLHSSGVVHNCRALVFCGPSESGKTTIARLAGKRPVLNDETVAIVKHSRNYMAHATPFFGEGGPLMAMANAAAPLKSMFFLHKAKGFSHRRLTPREAVERAFSQVFIPRKDPMAVTAILKNLADFAAQVPCYDFFFAPYPDLWRYLDGIATE